MAAQPRPPVFELHIRPMFRLLEREHMTTLLTPGIDLWDLDAVWAKRNLILGRLRAEGPQTMPGAQVGGHGPPNGSASSNAGPPPAPMPSPGTICCLSSRTALTRCGHSPGTCGG